MLWHTSKQTFNVVSKLILTVKVLECNYGRSSLVSTLHGIQCAVSLLLTMIAYLSTDVWDRLDYGDVAFRIYGNWARVGVNFLQSFQFFLNVVLIIESSGQGLAQMAAGVNGNGFLCCK